jgi:hypothetical protein
VAVAGGRDVDGRTLGARDVVALDDGDGDPKRHPLNRKVRPRIASGARGRMRAA